MRELSSLRILIVDDHELIRRSLAHSLASEGALHIQEASSYQSAQSLLAVDTFDLIILDHNLGDGSGVDLSISIALNQPHAITVMLTLEEEWGLAHQAQRSHFSAFINKSASLKEIVAAIQQAINHPQRFAIYSPRMNMAGEKSNTQLTPTELEILREIHIGSTTYEIAQRRCNSEATVKTHLTSIYRKLKVRNRVEAIAEGRRLRLI